MNLLSRLNNLTKHYCEPKTLDTFSLSYMHLRKLRKTKKVVYVCGLKDHINTPCYTCVFRAYNLDFNQLKEFYIATRIHPPS